MRSMQMRKPPPASLTIDVDGAGKDVQELGEDESYSLSVLRRARRYTQPALSAQYTACRRFCNWSRRLHPDSPFPPSKFTMQRASRGAA